jgi:hypothetical protein
MSVKKEGSTKGATSRCTLPMAGKKPTKPSRVMVRLALKTSPAAVEFRGLFKVRLLLGEDGRKHVIVAELADALGVAR